MFNSELPKVDITYGTKRFKERVYRSALSFFSMKAKSKTFSFQVTKLNGEVFISNPIKINARSGVMVFSNWRMLSDEIATIETLSRREFPEIESSTVFFDKSTLPKPKTFNLILNKAHATNKSVAVFLSSGKIYKGVSVNCDYDSVQLKTASGDVVIMYNAVKRIVPLEDDGSLAE
ncbi:hypothetical protein [Xenorhabdus bovienii]|uniref:hypothetical protein n=1 Tax=Xenorhabdus bovienii TaxID=40576 RepID=UPI003DA246EA